MLSKFLGYLLTILRLPSLHGSLNSLLLSITSSTIYLK
nr:MAG TPA: hypothetical protein [Caudoviricetes sp.]